MHKRNEYEEEMTPQRLGCRSLFAIISDAVFQDGKVEPYEQELLNKIAAFLKLPPQLAMDIARRSKERFHRGELGEATPINGEAVYERSLRLACADGTVDNKERTLLEALRKLFKIDGKKHNELMKLIKREMGRGAPPAAAPAAAPETTKIPADPSPPQPAPQKDLAAAAAPILAALENDRAAKPTLDELKPKGPPIKPKRYYLEPGGVPIPFVVNIGLAGLAAIIFLCGFFTVNHLFDRDDLYHKRRDRHKEGFFSTRKQRREVRRKKFMSRIHDGILFAFIAAGAGLYLFLRKKYEGHLLDGDNVILVGQGTLTLPRFATGTGELKTLGKGDIERVFLGIRDTGEVTSINFALKGSSSVLRFGQGSVSDVNELANLINDRLKIPFGREEQTFFDDHREVMIAGGIFLLAGGLALTVLLK